jgi:hypothetical protein
MILGEQHPEPKLTLWRDLRILFWNDTAGLHHINRLSKLPYRWNKTVRFVDLDDTLVARWPELERDLGMRLHRWESAYPYLDKQGWVWWYIDKFHRNAMSRFDNFREVLHWTYSNTQPVILTAWRKDYQTAKIRANDLSSVPSIIVPKAEMKIWAMIRFIEHLGYIPSKIEFIDDRIGNFAWLDEVLSRFCWVPVTFEKAVPNWYSVWVEQLTNRTKTNSANLTLH